MRRISLAGMALLATVAFGAVASSSASARSFCGQSETAEGNFTTATCGGTAVALSNFLLGETGQRIPNTNLWCVKTNAAHAVLFYANASCTTAATPVDTGQYGRVEGSGVTMEQNIAFPVKVKEKSSTITFTAAGGTKVTCKESSSEDELTSETAGSGTAKFTSCESAGAKCKTEGGAEGEIKMPVKATIGSWEEKKETFKTTLLLAFEGKFSCSVVKVEVKGSVTGVFEKEEWGTAFAAAFNVKEGKQEVADTLEVKIGAGAFEKATMSGVVTLEDFNLKNEEVFLM